MVDLNTSRHLRSVVMRTLTQSTASLPAADPLLFLLPLAALLLLGVSVMCICMAFRQRSGYGNSVSLPIAAGVSGLAGVGVGIFAVQRIVDAIGALGHLFPVVVLLGVLLVLTRRNR